MRYKTLFAAICAGITLSFSANAAKINHIVCPSTMAIQSGRVITAQSILFNYYAALQSSNYDTDQSWLFGIGLIEAPDKQNAIAQGNQLLGRLSDNPQPTYDASGSWACAYKVTDTKHCYAAIAMPGDFNSFSKIQAHLKRGN